MATKNDIFKEHKEVYWKSNKKGKGIIIRSICTITEMHAKAVIRKFKRLRMRDPATQERRGRPRYYTTDVTVALREIWEGASEPCGENLHPVIAEYVSILTRNGLWKHGEETTGKLLAMSEGTVKVRVGGFVHERGWLRGKSTTTPGAIHTLIPIRTGPWEDAAVGVMQLDTVAHCGGSIAGDYVYTVNATDVPTLWGKRRAQWNKGQEATQVNMAVIEKRTPFPIIEFHPDSGSEFINWHCKGWCEEQHIKLTRSRPYRKNDNCFVEERNGHVVRKFVGMTRFDAPEVVSMLNLLYDVLDTYLNHFIANKRTLGKEQVGSRWRRIREKKAKTPYQRILERNDVSDEVKKSLIKEHETLNPFILKDEIDRKIKKIFNAQKQRSIHKLNSTFR